MALRCRVREFGRRFSVIVDRNRFCQCSQGYNALTAKHDVQKATQTSRKSIANAGRESPYLRLVMRINDPRPTALFSRLQNNNHPIEKAWLGFRLERYPSDGAEHIGFDSCTKVLGVFHRDT